jgi:hypothetical protein
MFHTNGLNTGNVKLDAVIFGFCCACDAVVPTSAKAQAVASVARLRRDNVIMNALPSLCSGR